MWPVLNASHLKHWTTSCPFENVGSIDTEDISTACAAEKCPICFTHTPQWHVVWFCGCINQEQKKKTVICQNKLNTLALTPVWAVGGDNGDSMASLSIKTNEEECWSQRERWWTQRQRRAPNSVLKTLKTPLFVLLESETDSPETITDNNSLNLWNKKSYTVKGTSFFSRKATRSVGRGAGS